MTQQYLKVCEMVSGFDKIHIINDQCYIDITLFVFWDSQQKLIK